MDGAQELNNSRDKDDRIWMFFREAQSESQPKSMMEILPDAESLKVLPLCEFMRLCDQDDCSAGTADRQVSSSATALIHQSPRASQTSAKHNSRFGLIQNGLVTHADCNLEIDRRERHCAASQLDRRAPTTRDLIEKLRDLHARLILLRK